METNIQSFVFERRAKEDDGRIRSTSADANLFRQPTTLMAGTRGR